MNSQNTPVQIKLWHREFWQLAVANLFLSMSVYMLIPVLPVWLMEEENFSPVETGMSMGVFAFGLYLLGPFCSFLVQRYRRNMVYHWAILALVACLGCLWYIDTLKSEFVEFWLILLQRLVLGAAFGLAQMVLSSTLVIDTCESYQRTEANHSASWFGRFALSLGPLAGIIILRLWDFDTVIMVAMGCAAFALVLISLVEFPFRAPEEHTHLFSNDRFMLGQGWILFINLLLITLALGMMLVQMDIVAYGMLMVGFLLALLAQRFMFKDAELKSEVVSGLLILLASLLILLAYPASPASPLLMGLAVGIIGSRYLLFFIKLSRHCKRGTSHSTFFLAWETGITLGLTLGYALLYGQRDLLFYVAFALTIASLLFYHFHAHQWFIKHKNR